MKVLFLIITCFFLISSCTKQDEWLNIKNNKSDVSPKTLQDFQAILDNVQIMNASNPVIGLVGSDNVYFNDANLDAITAPNRNAYLWQKDIFQGANSADWQNSYQQVEYANIVLDGLATLETSPSEKATLYQLKGTALFFRAFAFYHLSQLFCKPYAPGSATSDPGIVIRLTSDVNQRSVRATVQQGYDQIMQDLLDAIVLLPEVPLYRTRPSTTAAYALLAKTCLVTQNYIAAQKYANDALQENSNLIDFNTLNLKANQPFPSFAVGNPEIILYAYALGNSAVWPLSSHGRVSPELYQLYDQNDLRKTALYALDSKTGLYRFKGSYEGSNFYNFTGLANNEILLIHAESLARTGDLTGALKSLNLLLSKRYDSSFIPFYTVRADILLQRIIDERRKELPFNGNVRWEDLRRLNQQPGTAVTLARTYRGQIYRLPPNSPLYTLPIPQNETDASGIQQNQR